jgi:hypothetical protein
MTLSLVLCWLFYVIALSSIPSCIVVFEIQIQLILFNSLVSLNPLLVDFYQHHVDINWGW